MGTHIHVSLPAWLEGLWGKCHHVPANTCHTVKCCAHGRSWLCFSPGYDEREFLRPPRAYFYWYYFQVEMRRCASERGSLLFRIRLSSSLFCPSSRLIAHLYFPQKTSKNKRIGNSLQFCSQRASLGGKVERRSGWCTCFCADLAISGPAQPPSPGVLAFTWGLGGPGGPRGVCRSERVVTS